MIRQLVHRAAAAVARATEDVPSVEALFGPDAGGSLLKWRSVRWREGTMVDVRPADRIRLLREWNKARRERGEEPPQGLLDLVDTGTTFDHLTGSAADVRPTTEEEQLEGIRERTRTLGAVVDHLAELQAMTPAEVKRYPHLARAFDSERKPIDQVGSATAEGRTGETLERAIAARTEPGGPEAERPPRTKAEINQVLAETRRDVSRQMTQTEQRRQQGTTVKRDVRRTCPSCQQKSGGPKSKACLHCHELFPPNPRKAVA